MNKTNAQIIKEYLLVEIPKHPHDIVAIAVSHFNVTRTTIHRHLSTLLKQNKIIKSGTTRNISYYLSTSINREFSYKIVPNLSEFDVYSQDFQGALLSLPEKISDICTYAFTEIFNNAIDHSQGSKIIAATSWDDSAITLTISDDGIGIFKNIFTYFHLDDIRESILQLTKGKMTTDPDNHTGEGLFFTSRAFDVFEIFANGLHYFRDNRENDWSISSSPAFQVGSKVIMKINVNAPTKLIDLFMKFQEEDNYAFDRTEILVELSRFEEEKLISRSQAKRILRNLDKFNRVTLDFTGVKLVGQGFVDEVFRVYTNQHPHVVINYINASDDVKYMIERGLATAKAL